MDSLKAGHEVLRWGVIGCGQIAHDRVIPAIELAAGSELVAFYDPDPARMERARQKAPEATPHDTLEGILGNPHVQAVYIATPNHLHAEQTVAAAAASKHVLVEKPMALDADQGRQMVEAADQSRVILMVAYMTLFNPAFQAAKRLVQTGLLGEIVAMRGRHSYTMSPESLSPAALWRLDPRHGGGPLMDVGVYSVFTLRELSGVRARSVAAVGAVRQLYGKAEYDSVVVSFLAEDGTPGAIEAGFTFRSSSYELEGTRGRLTLTGHISQAVGGRLEAEAWRGPGSKRESERIVHEVEPAGLPEFANYLGEIEHFAECVREGKEPISSGRVAVDDLAVADAVRESLRSGARVDLRW